jgi:hypothetical protein
MKGWLADKLNGSPFRNLIPGPQGVDESGAGPAVFGEERNPNTNATTHTHPPSNPALKRTGAPKRIEQNVMGSNKFAKLLDTRRLRLTCSADEFKQLLLHRVSPRRGCRVKHVDGALAKAGLQLNDVIVQVGRTVVLGAAPDQVIKELRRCTVPALLFFCSTSLVTIVMRSRIALDPTLAFLSLVPYVRSV